MCTLLVEYVPSLQRALAPAGAPAGARTVGICDDVPFSRAAVAAGAGFEAGAIGGALASQVATPPCPAQAPRCVWALEYEPSLHRAVAFAGAVALVALLELDFGDVLRGERDVDFVAGWDAGAERLELDREDVFLALTRLATPPWPEHRPLVEVAVEYVPSLHLAVAPAGA